MPAQIAPRVGPAGPDRPAHDRTRRRHGLAPALLRSGIMNKHVITAALLLSVVACGGGGKDEGPGKDWSGKPLEVTITDKVKNVGFTIKAPKGMKLEERGDQGAEAITRSWEADMKDNWNEPGFSVSYAAIPAKTIDDYVKHAMLDDNDVVAKKEATADGFVLVTHTKNKGIVRAQVMKRKGEEHIECRASQAGNHGPVKNPAKTLVWLEQLCSSLAFQ